MNRQQPIEKTKITHLIDEYLRIRAHSTALCASLQVEDYAVQPIAEVSPPKWHLGHTTWFFEEVILVKYMTDYSRYHQGYRMLFNSYYKSAGEHWLQSQRGSLSRPTVDEIIHYRNYVDQQVVSFLCLADLDEAVLSLLEIGLHHEQQHQELLLMDIKYILGCNPLSPVYCEQLLDITKPKKAHWRAFDEGIYEVGAINRGFAYDNEKPRHKRYNYGFAISENTITNGEYLAFIQDNGYDRAEFWLSLGWEWVSDKKIAHPLYWQKIKNEWFEFTLHGLMPLDLNLPVTHISYFEADAFANWKGLRLPTEHELEVYLQASSAVAETAGINKRNDNRASIYHPIASGVPFGQVWCWTKSHYSGYPGYKPYQGMLNEYNGKFMCNQFVLRGGCVATPSDHYRHSYRNFYQPHQRWMFSGIRLAKDIE
ncbi:ergothioneine biosynthesis protein EgtB [Pseudoalteromonas luteoviolacea]|uniref:ergothioneine biosynthesis protein EgtB n=1 Tax=Pseudoalteromonas luteoviolacea TaxID=43657 RepID=UPI001EEE7021|nr:ergothioneine biosynthesis protein EgtB [Pseudoalteromonas luteoviolacea]MCF6439431.1 ergothioneine biosynthesis protein EgtB [Pseudoalteromonas luteoviolacea]